MDNFLKELVLNLSACREKVVLVLYGDHLPSLGLSGELLSNGNAFQTEYVIWSNFGLKAEDKNLQAFQLSARVLQMLGIEEGIMPKYHMYRCDEQMPIFAKTSHGAYRKNLVKMHKGANFQLSILPIMHNQ